MQNHRFPSALLSLLSLLAVVASFSSSAYAESNAGAVQASATGTLSPASESVQRKAAEVGLAILIARSHSSASAFHPNRIFDLTSGQKLDDATLGDGFETYLVDPKMLLSGKDLGDSLYASGEWRFVIVLNGKGIGLVTVACIDGTWTMVAAGASALAAEITAIAATYAQQTPGTILRVIRSRQAVADFIQVSSPGRTDAAKVPLYVPLASARSALASPDTGAAIPGTVLSDAQLDDALRERVRRGMRDVRFEH